MDIEENTTIGLFIANKIKNALHSMKGEYKFMKKKAIKLATSTAIAASAFVAGAPAQKADAAVNVDQLVIDAQNAGTVLKWAISVEGSADYETQPWAQYNAAKKAIAAAEKAIAGASASDKLKYEAKLTDPKIQVKRAGAYIDAITSSGKIVELTEGLNAAVKSNELDKVEAAYHKATAEYRKQSALLDRVYGQSTRDGIRSLVKPALEKAVADVKYEVTVHMLAKSAAADVKADKLEDAAKKLTEAQEYLDKNVKKWKEELQKSVTDVENSIPLKALSVSSDNKDTVTVKFSTKIQDGAGVIPAGQFTFTNGLIVQSASVAKDGKTVTLKTTDQKVGTTYALAYQGVSTGLSFTTPASAEDKTISVVETEVANIDNGGERAYTVNVTKADGTAYTGKVKIELLAKATDKVARSKSEVIVRSVNGQFQSQDYSTPASYEVFAVNGKVTFIVKDNESTTLTHATKDVVPKITRLEDEAYKVAPKTTFWKVADVRNFQGKQVVSSTFDEKNGFLYTEVDSEKLKYEVKSTDKFFIQNVEVSKEAFFKAYSRQDRVSFDFNKAKNYVSTFRIDVDVTADAELEITNPAHLTADTNATRLEGKGQPGHIIDVYKDTVVARQLVASTTVDANGNWVVNSLNLDADKKNDFIVVSRHINDNNLNGSSQESVSVYQGYYATSNLFAIDKNTNGQLDIGDELELSFAHDIHAKAKERNELKVSDNATITLQDSLGATRTYTVGKVDKTTHKLVIKGIERKEINDGYNFRFGNTVIATSGITNQDNLVFNAAKSTDKIVDSGYQGPVAGQGAVTYINATDFAFALADGTTYTVNANTSIMYRGQIIAAGLTDVKAMIGTGKAIAVGDTVKIDGDVITIVSSVKLTADEAAFQAKIDAVWTKAKAGSLATGDLVAVTGLTHTVANVAAYQTAIAAKTAADVNTVAKLQAVINQVDADVIAAALQAKIDAVKAKANLGTLATADLDEVTGLTYTAANLTAYQTAIAALATVDVDTVAELQAVINKVDADALKVAEVAKYTNAASSTAMKALLDAAADGSSNPLGLNMSRYNGLNTTLKNKLSVDMEAIKATLTTVEAIQEAINSL